MSKKEANGRLGVKNVGRDSVTDHATYGDFSIYMYKNLHVVYLGVPVYCKEKEKCLSSHKSEFNRGLTEPGT